MKKRIIFWLVGVIILLGVFYASSYLKKENNLKSPGFDEGVGVEFKEEVNDEIILTGELETIVYDDVEPRYEYFIDSNGQKTQVFFSEPVFLKSGTSVNLKVKMVGGKWISDPKDLQIASSQSIPVTGNAIQNVPVLPAPETIGPQRTAVILIKFNDSDSSNLPFTIQRINNSIFNGVVNNFIRENSFNQTWLTGNTYGWYTLNSSCNSSQGWISFDMPIPLVDLDINFLNVDRIIVISDSFCSPLPNGYATIGKMNLNSSDGLFKASISSIKNSVFFYEPVRLPSSPVRNDNLTSGLGVTIHEFGHNLGVHHANNLDCGNQTISNISCLHGEYGNFYDIMGRSFVTGTPLGFGGTNYELNPNAAFHFNAVFKEYIQWIGSSNVIRISRNGTYVLKPLEKRGVIAAKIYATENRNYRPYYLEYRIPSGYDYSLNDLLSRGNLGGIFINVPIVQRLQEEIYLTTELLDMSPTTLDSFDRDWYNVSLTPGTSFFDRYSGVKVNNIREDVSNPQDPKIIFSVEFYPPMCYRANPRIEITDRFGNNYARGNRGSTLNLTGQLNLLLVNQDSLFCSDSTFQFSIASLFGWSYRFNQPNIILPSESVNYSKSRLFEVDIPPNIAPGIYEFFINVTNLNSSLSSLGNFTIRVA